MTKNEARTVFTAPTIADIANIAGRIMPLVREYATADDTATMDIIGYACACLDINDMNALSLYAWTRLDRASQKVIRNWMLENGWDRKIKRTSKSIHLAKIAG